MKNMEREKFEGSWKKAFEGAEVSPSENVWTNIELDLEKARGGELKKRLIFYKMLAAACVVFAMALGTVGYYHAIPRANTSSLANNSKNDVAKPKASADKNATALSEPVDKPDNGASLNDAAEQNSGAKRVKPQVIEVRQTSVELAPPAGSDKNSTGFAMRERNLAPLYEPREIRLNIRKSENFAADPVAAMLAKLEKREQEMQGRDNTGRKTRSGHENLWTSVGIAAGSFNTVQVAAAGPVSGSPGQAFASAMAAPIIDQESKASGYSYTMGVNVGTKLSERWILQGGINYLNHSSEYTANNVVMESVGKFNQQQFRAASTNDLVNADENELSNKLVYSAPYSVNNSMRYLSVPMQAGYLLINKTFGLQLNAGVATDLFLQNTVKAESQHLARTTQPSGSDSPYRAVNLSGLFGTEVSYRFGPHYRVSLNPGIRYPFNTIYKSEVGVQSTPLTFDVGLRFRYIFH